MSLGMLSGPGVFPLVNLLRQLSYISLVKLFGLFADLGVLVLSNIMPCGECHGYFRIAHMHVCGWSVVSSHMGLVVEMVLLCVVYFFGYFIGFGKYVILWVLYAIKGVRSCGWNIFLCMVLGLVFSRALYFLMAILQFIEVCLVIF